MTDEQKDDWLQKVFNEADDHGDGNGDVDYTIGDFQCLFGAAFRLLTAEQRKAFASDQGVVDAFGLYSPEGLLSEIAE